MHYRESKPVSQSLISVSFLIDVDCKIRYLHLFYMFKYLNVIVVYLMVASDIKGKAKVMF